MSPSRHISHSLLLPNTGLQVNTSSKSSEQYYRFPCPHLAISLIFYYYLLQVYRSTRCQNPRSHTSTTGQHVCTSPHLLSSTITCYRSTCQHVVKTLKTSTTGQHGRHLSYCPLGLLLLLLLLLQVYMSLKPSESYQY